MPQVPAPTPPGSFAEAIVATVRHPFLVLDHELRVVAANRGYYEAFRTGAEATLGEPFFQLGNRQWDDFALRRLLGDVLSGAREVNDFEMRRSFPAVGERVMLLNAHRFVPDPAKPPMVFLSVEDVTRSVGEAERTLAERDFAESILETLRDPLLVLDSDLAVLAASPAFFDAFSTTPERTLGRRIYDLGNGQWNIPRLRDLLEHTLSETRSFRDYEVDHVFPDLGRRVMLLNGRRVYDKGRGTDTILLVIEDITERKRSESFIHFQAKALNSVKDAVVALDGADRVTYWNAPAEELFQEPRSAVLGRPIAEVCSRLGPGDGGAAESIFAMPPVPSGWIEHHVRLHRSDRAFWLESSVNGIEADDFAPGRLVVVRDITDRKLADLELRQKNENLELFAALASHDLQEPLRAVAAHLGLLRKRCQGALGVEAETHLGHAMDGALRMRQLITDLLRYARVRLDPQHLEHVNLSQIVESAIDDLRLSIQEAKAEVRVGPMPDVTVDVGLLRHVFQNLLGNSLKYRGEADPVIAITAEPDRKSGWIVCVKDNGRGFDVQDAARAFQLFQRLAPRGPTSGTGMGLTLTRKIVEAHGGTIWAESTVGSGSSFYFRLPARP